ncbi:MazG-like family protein [Streptomyces sp. NPDC002889]|uniref:MazG-like family protein n=1 Tax=Streptomyces sp. NPDC002889 TaxID=3364669 RepID=UPI0036CD14F0
MLNPDQWKTITGLVGWLDRENGRDRQEITLRLLKLTEEAGEVAQAWIGAVGQNPRKGTTHSPDDVAAELCDVIVTAAVALVSIVDADAEPVFAAKLQRIADRVAALEVTA